MWLGTSLCHGARSPSSPPAATTARPPRTRGTLPHCSSGRSPAMNTYPTLACRKQAKALSIVHTEGRAAGHVVHLSNGSGEQLMVEQNTRIDDRVPAATEHKQVRQHRQRVGLEPRIPARRPRT